MNFRFLGRIGPSSDGTSVEVTKECLQRCASLQLGLRFLF